MIEYPFRVYIAGDGLKDADHWAVTFQPLNSETSGHRLAVSTWAAATQTGEHLHAHIVPRREDDGLHLPWTGQVRQEVA